MKEKDMFYIKLNFSTDSRNFKLTRNTTNIGILTEDIDIGEKYFKFGKINFIKPISDKEYMICVTDHSKFYNITAKAIPRKEEYMILPYIKNDMYYKDWKKAVKRLIKLVKASNK